MTARLQDWDIGNFDSASLGGGGSVGRGGGSVGSAGGGGEGRGRGGGGVGGAAVTAAVAAVAATGVWAGGRARAREAYEEELAELSWKIGRLMEIFLSTELQVCVLYCTVRAACSVGLELYTVLVMNSLCKARECRLVYIMLSSARV